MQHSEVLEVAGSQEPSLLEALVLSLLLPALVWKEERLVGFSSWGEARALLRMSDGNLAKPRERKAQKL